MKQREELRSICFFFSSGTQLCVQEALLWDIQFRSQISDNQEMLFFHTKTEQSIKGGGVTHQTFFLGPKMSGVSVLLRLRHPDSLVLQWTALHFWYFRVGSNKHEVITVPQISGRTRTCHMTIFTAKTLILCETPGIRFNERKVCRSRCARAKLAAGVQLNRCFSCDVFPSRKFYVLCGSSLWCCLW